MPRRLSASRVICRFNAGQEESVAEVDYSVPGEWKIDDDARERNVDH